MKRAPTEALLDMVSAMAERVEDEALAEAYAELYQALGALLLQEDEDKLAKETTAFIRDWPTAKTIAVRGALRRIYELSPGDYTAVFAAVVWTMLHTPWKPIGAADDQATGG